MKTLYDFRRDLPWSKIKNIKAFPFNESIEKLSRKDLGRVIVYQMKALIELKQQLDAKSPGLGGK